MGARLPTGTVTFLFTDVEGSTRVLAEIGPARYAEALTQHHRLIRETVAAHGGIEVDTQGDAFFCVFASVRDAVACAQQAQERLAATPIRVRMGLHTGEALVVDDHYVGMDVHRAARVAASGHGGQVLLSPTTEPLLEPGSFSLRDLGKHRLKDLSAPLRLYQLGDADFPPLKTLHRTNLPVPATSFVGRRRELESVLAEATDHSVRLLTLTGPGGTGKTRLALQVAAELAEGFPGGVFWVPLAQLRDPDLVGFAVAQALGVEEEGGKDVAQSIASAIDGPMLVLIDNCEHVLDGVAAVVSPLIRSGANLRVIATSREPLSLAGERVVPVDPLVRSDAVALFRARAEAAGALASEDDIVGMLCARLDDLPLAVELAAARAATLPPPLLLERLSQRLELLRGPRDADERQRTLRATIGWSYDLLALEEQRLFRRISVFVGGATVEAIEEVADADVDELASLVAKSLVRMTPAAHGPRYWMLETIREFASAQLSEADEDDALRDRYIRWFAGMAVEADAHLAEPDAATWLERLETDLGNLRVAFGLALDHDPEVSVALGGLLGALHAVRGRYAEAHDAVVRAISLTDEPLLSSKLRLLLGNVLVRRNEVQAAATAYAEAEELLGSPTTDESWWRRWLDTKLAQAHLHYWRADSKALARAAEDLRPYVERHATPQQHANFLHLLHQNAVRQERYVLSEQTEELARAAFAASKKTGDWDAHFQLGFALLWRGNLDEADEHLRLGCEEARAIGDVLSETRCLVYGSVVRRKRGDVEAVRTLDKELAKLEDTYGYGGLIAANRAWLAWRDRDADAAGKWGTTALAEWDRAGGSGPTVFQWSARFPLLALDVEQGRIESASEHARFMLDDSQQPLPADVQSSLRDALHAGTGDAFTHAIEVGRRYGYT